VNFMEGLSNPSWRMTALLLLGMILFLVILRIREARRISVKFPRERIVLTSFAVTYYGLDSEPGGPLRSLGALVLLKDGLYFRARVTNHELTIPGPAITHIGVTNTHKGRTLRLYVVAIRFLTPEGKEETAAFRFPLPVRWIAAIKATLIEGRALSPAQPPAEPEADTSPPSAGEAG